MLDDRVFFKLAPAVCAEPFEIVKIKKFDFSACHVGEGHRLKINFRVRRAEFESFFSYRFFSFICFGVSVVKANPLRRDSIQDLWSWKIHDWAVTVDTIGAGQEFKQCVILLRVRNHQLRLKSNF